MIDANIYCCTCHRTITPREVEMGWPVITEDGGLCPDCYEASLGEADSESAYCAECGALLRCIEGAKCPACY